MVHIRLFRDEDGDLTGFIADGHTGYAARGSDVVCAGVSVLTTVTVLGLQARLKLSPEVRVDHDQGYLECHLDRRMPAELWVRAQDLLETMVLGLHEIAREHSKYVCVKEVKP